MKRATAAPQHAHTFAVLRHLADGEFHSGQAIGQALGLARSTVHEAVRDVATLGLTLQRVRGRGYRLLRPIIWLDAAAIRPHLAEQAAALSFDLREQGDSSNSLLLQAAAQGAPSGRVLALEWQSAGRGRWGRPWLSGLGDALTFSLLWRYPQGLAALSGLSLAVGVALLRALHELGVTAARLKWPNDVILPQGKLAGVLVEAQGDMLGPSVVVVGVGLNLWLDEAAAARIGQPVADLAQQGIPLAQRNRVFGVLLKHLGRILSDFGAQGFAPLRTEWERHHAWQGQTVCLSLPDGTQWEGVARGVNEAGALRVSNGGGERWFTAGEISVRRPA
ncbi:MAG: bifunctional biotin--[acetyl-CoA-carboxylase] ligase/biotin operon repressor BirA [Sideroxydans sp.]